MYIRSMYSVMLCRYEMMCCCCEIDEMVIVSFLESVGRENVVRDTWLDYVWSYLMMG